MAVKITTINRISAWLLFLIVVIHIVTGFSMTGFYGFDYLIDKNLARNIHLRMHAVLLLLLILHVGISTYYDLKRRKMIK